MPDKLTMDLRKRMEASLASFHNDLKGLRTGRASTALLENVSVEVYGSKMPLNQVATISVPEPRLLSVQVWDKGNVPLVEKAISIAGLGLNPSSDGNLVRVPLPDLSQERRKEMVKIASQYAERSKVAVRNVRRDGMDALKKMEKDSHISEDDHRHHSDAIQKITDEYIKKIDDAFHTKEKDIMEV